MAVVRLRNGMIGVTVPNLMILKAPDVVTYNGKEVPGDMFIEQDITLGVHPREVDDLLKWKGDLHGDGLDVVEVLSDEEAATYFKS